MPVLGGLVDSACQYPEPSFWEQEHLIPDNKAWPGPQPLAHCQLSTGPVTTMLLFSQPIKWILYTSVRVCLTMTSKLLEQVSAMKTIDLLSHYET